jgi:isoquinoline 1-oxidoreductase beta subunit
MNTFDSQRRAFLQASAALSGGLLLGLSLPTFARAAGAAEASAPFSPNAWIRIAPDDTVTLIMSKVEMGQGVHTSLPMLVAEELEVEVNTIRLEDAPPDKAYADPIMGFQATGGSTSVRGSWQPLREAAAAARLMLVAAAAEIWKVKPGECHAENGAVLHRASQRRLTYGQLAEAAARQPLPETIALKDAKQLKYLGKPVHRRDTPAKVNGSAVFGIDVHLPGLLTAVFLPCPVFGGKPAKIDDRAAKAVKGVKQVFALDHGVAVVADGFWAASQGRDALQVQWDEGSLAKLDSAAIEQQLEAAAAEVGVLARNDGDATAALGKAAKTLDAAYHSPYLAHATMEPMNCTVDLRDGACQIWVGSQAVAMTQDTAARITGLPKDKVKVHITYLGGGFGRRFEQDFIAQAVGIAKQVQAPVKLIWTREDDMRHDFYRPASFSRLRAGLDAHGLPVAWEQHIACPSLMKARFPQLLKEDGKLDHSSVEGAADHLYAIPNIRVHYTIADPGVPTGFWRSVGNSQNGFVTESFIDELAHAAGQDPLRYRLQLLRKQPRLHAVLELVAKQAGWGGKLPKNQGRGIAAVFSFGSFAAEVAEVEVAADGAIKVKRVVCAIDCGAVVNPDTVKAQMESAIIFALTAALKGPITIKNGRVEQSNFHDYPLLRLDETPVIEVHILPSEAAPGGVGEPGVPPLAPAVANAVFAATGQRLRRMPLRLQSS